jgi:hypothetical protein
MMISSSVLTLKSIRRRCHSRQAVLCKHNKYRCCVFSKDSNPQPFSAPPSRFDSHFPAISDDLGASPFIFLGMPQ